MYLLTVITSATVVDAPNYDADTGNIKEFFPFREKANVRISTICKNGASSALAEVCGFQAILFRF